MTYQGWTNYETWAVSLWIDNEKALYTEATDMARQSVEDEQEDWELADTLKHWIEDMKPDLGASLWSDLLNGALSEVDWLEISQHYLDTAKESI